MDLQTYLKQKRGRAAALARQLPGVYPPDVCNWAKGKVQIPFHLGAAIELATGGAVTREEMFPNDWRRFWPELDEPDRRRLRVETQPA